MSGQPLANQAVQDIIIENEMARGLLLESGRPEAREHSYAEARAAEGAELIHESNDHRCTWCRSNGSR